MRLFIALVLGALAACSAPPPPTPTPLACDALYRVAVQTAASACADRQAGQLCYGHGEVEASGLNAIGDRAPVADIQVVRTSPLDAYSYGIALIQLRAVQPEPFTGQDVSFVLYGGASLDYANKPEMLFATSATETTCTGVPPAGVLVQSPSGEPVLLNINGAIVSPDSTIWLSAEPDDRLTIVSLAGDTRVSFQETVRVVPPGGQVSLPLAGLRVAAPPGEAQPYNATPVENAPFSLLEIPITLPAPMALVTGPTPTAPLSLLITSTPPPVTLQFPPTATPTACAPRADWTGTYTIQSGDSLFAIAQQFGLTVAELQRANCIEDANQIFAGQTLRVPATDSDGQAED